MFKILKYISLSIAAIMMLLLSVVFYIWWNDRNPNPHKLEIMRRENQLYHGYHPFTDREITKVCMSADRDALKQFGTSYPGEYYRFEAIAEYRGSKIDVGFAEYIDRNFNKEINRKSIHCSDTPSLLIVKKIGGSWMIGLEE